MLLIFQRLIKWMPIILFVLLLLLDRENLSHVISYIVLLLSYTIILVAKILHAKNEWHSDPKTSKISGDKNIQKMSDFLEKMDELGEEE
tara:strand:- start:105 stop:371 length:267 start_codon:yes stop_codon:yes gene_type:complete